MRHLDLSRIRAEVAKNVNRPRAGAHTIQLPVTFGANVGVNILTVQVAPARTAARRPPPRPRSSREVVDTIS